MYNNKFSFPCRNWQHHVYSDQVITWKVSALAEDNIDLEHRCPNSISCIQQEFNNFGLLIWKLYYYN